MGVKFKLDSQKVPDGTVLVFGIRYEPQNPGQLANPTVYEHVALKARGRWYMTGSGPRDAGWGAIERWLEKDGRVVEYVNAMAQTVTLWPLPPSPEGTAGQPAVVPA